MKVSSIFICTAVTLASILAIAESCGCGAQLPQDPFDPLGKWHQRHLDCGIPPFAYRLPQDAQAKIHAIWINYETGDDCEVEQEATRNVIFSIPDEVRYAAFKGVCGPGFLVNESADTRDEFFKVWSSESLNIHEKEAEFKKLAKEHLKGKAVEKFEKFLSNLDDAIKQREQFIQSMSSSAREAYNKWNKMRKEERSFLSGLPHDVRAELGLVCKCCGGCKSEHQNNRAARSVSTSVSVDALVGSLARADRQMLHEAAEPECSLAY